MVDALVTPAPTVGTAVVPQTLTRIVGVQFGPVAIEEWLYELLTDGTDLEVYTDAAPQDAEYPFIVIAYLDGSDVFGVGTERFMTACDYKVVVADRTESWATLRAYAMDIDGIIHGQWGDPSRGGSVLSCVRTEPFVQREVVNGVEYASLGGIYHINVQEQSRGWPTLGWGAGWGTMPWGGEYGSD